MLEFIYRYSDKKIKLVQEEKSLTKKIISKNFIIFIYKKKLFQVAYFGPILSLLNKVNFFNIAIKY